LSDQVFGSFSKSHEVRAACVKYMKDHPHEFIDYLEFYPGGGIRRNAKRKCTSPTSSSDDLTPPSQHEIHLAYKAHLKRMARKGTWGGHMEIVAFTKAYNMDVRVHQRSNVPYFVQAGNDGVGIAHIAYDQVITPSSHEQTYTNCSKQVGEHYSSVRSIIDTTSTPSTPESSDSSSEEDSE
jgi:OTU domain-containing protein 3